MQPSVLTIALGLATLGAVAWALERSRRRQDAERAYRKAVRSMISDDPDAAIEALSDAARLGSPEAVDTYLALGELFRRTGDLARAMRLHRNMLLSPWLDAARRGDVERELALDCRRSGMLDEARQILTRLAPADRRAVEALREVLADQGAWAEAAAAQSRLVGDGPDRLRGHLLAAGARAALRAPPGSPAPTGLELARQAVEADPEGPDPALALAEALAAAGDSPGALERLDRALAQGARAALLAWPAVARVPDAEAALRTVRARLAADPSAALHMLEGRLLHRQGRRAEALGAFRRALDEDASGEVTLALRDLLREAVTPAPGTDDLEVRHELVVTALQRRARSVRCVRCGSEAPAVVWRCRACGAFDAYA